MSSSDHLPPGAELDWEDLMYNFKRGKERNMRFVQIMLDELFSPGIQCSIDELFANSPKFQFRDLTRSSCPYPIAASDMDGVAEVISKAFVSINDSMTDMQSTVAMVPQNGVGHRKDVCHPRCDECPETDRRRRYGVLSVSVVPRFQCGQ